MKIRPGPMKYFMPWCCRMEPSSNRKTRAKASSRKSSSVAQSGRSGVDREQPQRESEETDTSGGMQPCATEL